MAFLGLVGLFVSLYFLHYDMKPRHLTFAVAYNGTLASAFLFLAADNLEKLTLSYELIAVFTLALFLSTVPKKGRITARNYIVLTQVFGIIPPLLIATSLAYSAVGSVHGLTFEALRKNLGGGFPSESGCSMSSTSSLPSFVQASSHSTHGFREFIRGSPHLSFRSS
ncbi:hypothetical protein [Thermococcus peptonophilus]|uniref:hypothetical protein n=1 Tax=Thermococcus peptonophilus TaxID=53952 RepID=UPI000A7D146C